MCPLRRRHACPGRRTARRRSGPRPSGQLSWTNMNVAHTQAAATAALPSRRLSVAPMMDWT